LTATENGKGSGVERWRGLRRPRRGALPRLQRRPRRPRRRAAGRGERRGRGGLGERLPRLKRRSGSGTWQTGKLLSPRALHAVGHSGGRARASAAVTCGGRIYRSVVGFRTMSVALPRTQARVATTTTAGRAPSSLLLPASSPRHSRVQREAAAAAGVSVREWLQHVLVSTQHS
jgi:hypothetical protein